MDRTDIQLLIERERRAYIEGRVEEAALLALVIDSWEDGF